MTCRDIKKIEEIIPECAESIINECRLKDNVELTEISAYWIASLFVLVADHYKPFFDRQGFKIYPEILNNT